MATTYKEKTEEDLIFDENKKAIRSAVRLMTDRIYTRLSNAEIAKMEKFFNAELKQGRIHRIVDPLPEAILESVSKEVHTVLALPPAKDK